MAPEYAPSVVIFDARIEKGSVTGSCEYIEPTERGGRLRVRWAVESQPEGFDPVGGGVAYIYTKDLAFNTVPISREARPFSLGDQRYRWNEGLNLGVPWVMFILILPLGYTLLRPIPAPAGARTFRDRLALYWVLRGDDIGRTKVEWSLSRTQADLEVELVRLSRMLSSDSPSEAPSLTIVDGARDSASSSSSQRNPWISGSFYLIAAITIMALLAVLSVTVNLWALPVVLIAGLLLVVIIGALQLRNDQALRDESFLTLMVETLKRLPLLRGGGRGGGNRPS